MQRCNKCNSINVNLSIINYKYYEESEIVIIYCEDCHSSRQIKLNYLLKVELQSFLESELNYDK